MMVTNRADFKPFITLEENGQEVQVTDGAVVSQKLAQLASVTVGDKLELDGRKSRLRLFLKTMLDTLFISTERHTNKSTVPVRKTIPT